VAPPRSASSRSQTEAATEQQQTAREGEAERVEEEMIEEETAEERRQREEARAEQLKSVPEGAQAPLERTTRGGETAFKRDHLLANARALTEHEEHVLVGALHGDDREYLTATEAQRAADDFLDREDLTGQGY
jgi:hypothetical protein